MGVPLGRLFAGRRPRLIFCCCCLVNFFYHDAMMIICYEEVHERARVPAFFGCVWQCHCCWHSSSIMRMRRATCPAPARRAQPSRLHSARGMPLTAHAQQKRAVQRCCPLSSAPLAPVQPAARWLAATAPAPASVPVRGIAIACRIGARPGGRLRHAGMAGLGGQASAEAAGERQFEGRRWHVPPLAPACAPR